jgi:hypothetical protein
MNMQATGQTIAAPRPALSPTDLSIPRSKGIVVGFWIVWRLSYFFWRRVQATPASA